MDGYGKTPAGLSDTRAIGGGARRDLAPESRCTLAESASTMLFGNAHTPHLLEDVEPAAAFQWAVLAEEAMREGYPERAEGLVELAYSANDFWTSCP
nr:hypothetical protein [uncultured Rhodopila sp.]